MNADRGVRLGRDYLVKRKQQRYFISTDVCEMSNKNQKLIYLIEKIISSAITT